MSTLTAAAHLDEVHWNPTSSRYPIQLHYTPTTWHGQSQIACRIFFCHVLWPHHSVWSTVSLSSVVGGAHMHFIHARISGTSTKHVRGPWKFGDMVLWMLVCTMEWYSIFIKTTTCYPFSFSLSFLCLLLASFPDLPQTFPAPVCIL